MSYYRAQRLRSHAAWVRRGGYVTLPIILLFGSGAARGESDAGSILIDAAMIAALVLAATEAIGWLLEKRADREAKR